MATTRRMFLKTSGIALVGLGAVPPFLARALDGLARRGKTLVVVFLRGAVDGLNVVVPHGDPRYYDARRSIAVPRGNVADLDGFFGLHPALKPLLPLYRDGVLGVVHATGLPHASRSHFDAQDYLETGTPGVRRTRDGWMNRCLRPEGGVLQAAALTSRMPRILQGPRPALGVRELERFDLRAGAHTGRVERMLRGMYASCDDPVLGPAGREALEALDEVRKVRASVPRGAGYPAHPFGRAMAEISQLIRAGVGLEVAFADFGGWDFHVNQGGAEGPMARLLEVFAGTLRAFFDELGARRDDVVVATVSEFGRTVAENGNRGTDHGHATVSFLAGGGVRGGRVHGAWPGLRPGDRFEGRDLARTTDVRDVLAQVLTGHLGVRALDRVFPGFAPDPKAPRVLAGLSRGSDAAGRRAPAPPPVPGPGG